MIKQRLIQLFDQNTIGLIGERNENGADRYYCPCCGAEEKIKGHASNNCHISAIKHIDTEDSQCELFKLFQDVMNDQE